MESGLISNYFDAWECTARKLPIETKDQSELCMVDSTIVKIEGRVQARFQYCGHQGTISTWAFHNVSVTLIASVCVCLGAVPLLTIGVCNERSVSAGRYTHFPALTAQVRLTYREYFVVTDREAHRRHKTDLHGTERERHADPQKGSHITGSRSSYTNVQM